MARIRAAGRLAEVGVIPFGVGISPEHTSPAAPGAQIAGNGGPGGQGSCRRLFILSLELAAGSGEFFRCKPEAGRSETAGQIEGVSVQIVRQG